MLLAHLIQRLAHRVHDVDLAAPLAAHDFDGHHRLAIQQGQGAGLGYGVLYRGDAIEAYRAAIG